MIKFFQKLKAKKGFTLVELIVVIAIIGVLAAILVPTMLGYVTSSRVTSANSTASSLKNNIDTFLTNADTAGYGMKLSKDCKAELQFTVDDKGIWSVQLVAAGNAKLKATTFGAQAFKKGGNISWTSDSTKMASSKASCSTAQQLLATELASLFPEIKNAAIVAYLEGGKCLYLCYTADTKDLSDLTPTTIPQQTHFKAEAFEWDKQTAGVTSNGLILGTAPALTLKTA